MIVNGRLVSLGPTQKHDVELAVARMDEVARVFVLVELGVFAPIWNRGKTHCK